MFEKEAEEYGIASREICADVDDSDLIAEAFIDGAKFGYNEKHSELEIELKWERETKSELADHLGKANDKVADLEETINKLREQLSLRYDLENKIKELEEANKANEWHYVKDGKYPKENQLVMVYRVNPLGANIAITNWYDSYKDTKVIAWKEIVLPKEIE